LNNYNYGHYRSNIHLYLYQKKGIINKNDLKYLAAYIPPALLMIGIIMGGWMAFSTVVFSFVLVPILEGILPKQETHYSEIEKATRVSNWFFDVVLYFNVPIVWVSIILLGVQVNASAYNTMELVGLVLSLGIVQGANGINVGHELGHRENWFEQLLAKMLLLPSFYMHFTIEHNRGHHKNVGTLLDPATARFGEILYFFWLRSAIGGYLHAWSLEKQRLSNDGRRNFSLENEMIQFTLIQIMYLGVIFSVFGPFASMLLVVAALISVLLLESINYVEHYGLTRTIGEDGRYERIKSRHSWNSNHEIGRIILFELTRHSDHHYKTSKKYQILEHQDSSPQLPYGYPTSILISIIPFLWRSIMHREMASLNLSDILND
jgi:alkane 1-monooxygenase